MPPVVAEYFLPNEVAERSGYSISFVYMLVREGKLRTVRVGRRIRIPAAEVDRFLKIRPYQLLD